MLSFKVFITRKIVVSGDDKSLHQAEGERIHRLLKDPSVLGVFIISTDFLLTVGSIKRLERMFGSVFQEKVSVIY